MNPHAQSRSVIVRSLVASGLVLVAVGIAVGLWQGAIFLLIAAVGLIDFALAWAFATGRLGVAAAEAELTQNRKGRDAAADQPRHG